MSRERYTVRVDQYADYQKNGCILIPGLLNKEDWQSLAAFMIDMYEGRIMLQGFDSFHSDAEAISVDQRLQTIARAHMLHRVDRTIEWALLHPRILDVLEALIGPDVLALQSMLFFNPPGRGGQGWHQDSYYIPTYPDTLIGVWAALDEVDEENGCLWVVPTSHNEPVYPGDNADTSRHTRDAFHDLISVANVSHLNDEINTLSRVSRKYNPPIPVRMHPGDILFFHSHLLHRSHPNRSKDRFRKSFVGHYCNARSWVPWNHGKPYEGDSANYLHILCRGSTHLPFASPVYGTEIQLALQRNGERAARMMAIGDNMMPAAGIEIVQHDD